MFNGFLTNNLKILKAKKISYLFLIVTVIMILIIFASGQLRQQAEGLAGASGAAGEGDINALLLNPYISVMDGFISFLVFLAILGSASVFPNMLVRGRAEYYLSRPLSRTSFYFTNLISIFLTYSLLISLCTTIIVLLTLVVHGLFSISVVTLLLANLLSFIIWLSISVFVAIFSGSTVFSIMTVFILWIAQSVLQGYKEIAEFIGSSLVGKVLEITYWILPKTSEIGNIGAKMALNLSVESYLPVYSSILFMVAVIFVTNFIFSKKNY